MNRPVILVTLGVALTGCAASEVKSRFVQEASCPSDRVTVQEVGTVEGSPVAPPPPEIAADQARADIYYRTHRDPDIGRRVLLAEGCGEHLRYTCDHVGARGHRFCEKAGALLPGP